MTFDAFHLQGPLQPSTATCKCQGLSWCLSLPHPACLKPNFIPKRQTPALPYVPTPPGVILFWPAFLCGLSKLVLQCCLLWPSSHLTTLCVDSCHFVC